MTHYACVKHSRRIVHVNGKTWVHRNGDGSRCDTEFFRQGGIKFDARTFERVEQTVQTGRPTVFYSNGKTWEFKTTEEILSDILLFAELTQRGHG